MCKFINLNSMNPNGPKGVYVKDGKQIVKWEPGAELILLLPDGKSYRKVREGEWVVRDWGNISKYTQEDFDAMFEIVLE